MRRISRRSCSEVGGHRRLDLIRQNRRQVASDIRVAASTGRGLTPLLAQRKFPAEEEVLRFDGSPRSERQHDEAGRVGKWPNDDSGQRDHATITLQPADGPATGSVRPAADACRAQPSPAAGYLVSGSSFERPSGWSSGSSALTCTRPRFRASSPLNQTLARTLVQRSSTSARRVSRSVSRFSRARSSAPPGRPRQSSQGVGRGATVDLTSGR